MIAIDGACRRIGQPDCVSASGVFILKSYYCEERGCIVESCESLKYSEQKSTNQRGELYACLVALEYVVKNNIASKTWIITDSAYIRNTLVKGWYISWMNNNWKTSTGEAVKNKDLWDKIIPLWEEVEDSILLLHIKGHVLSYGAVAAANVYRQDKTCLSLYKYAMQQYKEKKDQTTTKRRIAEAIQKFSNLNDGLEIPDGVFDGLFIVNSVADALANFVIEKY